jgi:tryptophan-rich sensory protein
MKINGIKAYVLFIALALITGGFAAFLIKEGLSDYSLIQKPALSPPAYVFGIIWTGLYILMGLSAGIIYNSAEHGRWSALTVYLLQLAANFLWPLIFFGFEAYLWAFIWLLLLLTLVIIMVIRFARISRTAAYLQIPYLVRLLFAGYLNLAIFILNR